MRTIALRFADKYAPEEGTIKAHQRVIEMYGFVWYGKMGNAVSQTILKELTANEKPRILLIHSGKPDRYWAYIDAAQREQPDRQYIPEYYRDNAANFRSWFRVTRFEAAPGDILAQCIVPSSGNTLSYTSKHSMSPYYIIDYAVPGE